jgi:hypothetical protein
MIAAAGAKLFIFSGGIGQKLRFPDGGGIQA